MKRLLTMIMLLCSVSVFGQIGRLPYKTLMQTYRGDTCKTTLDTDTVHYYTDLNIFDFNKPITVNGASPFSNFWTQTGSDIYFNTGKVGIGNDAPAYALDVTGLIGGSNIETNTTSLSTKLGYEAGLNEDETAPRYNVFIGHNSGYSNTTGKANTFNGYNTGSLTTTGNYNVFCGYMAGNANTTGRDNSFLGYQCGDENTSGNYNSFFGSDAGGKNTTGNLNVFIGRLSGSQNTTGATNVFIGSNAGASNTRGSLNIAIGSSSLYNNTTGESNVVLGVSSAYSNITGINNVIIGRYSRYFGNSSNELVIDNQQRGASSVDSLLYRNKSLIYGQFDADTLNQFVDINGRLRHTATTAEIYRHIDSTARTQSIPNGTTPTKIVVFSDNGVSSHCTADAANDKITITHPGIYDVKLSISYACGTNNVNWFARIFVGGVVATNIHSEGNTSTSGAYRSTSLSGKIEVTTVPVDIDYRVIHDYGSAVDLSFVAANLSVNYNGE